MDVKNIWAGFSKLTCHETTVNEHLLFENSVNIYKKNCHKSSQTTFRDTLL